MTKQLIAAVTPGGEHLPPYINATLQEDGSVRVTLRANSVTKDGCRICRYGPSDPQYRVGDCYPGGPGCNNYCNMHPDRKSAGGSMNMPPSPESQTFTYEGETVSAVFSKADWDVFVAACARDV